MSTSYSSNLKLGTPATNDPSWNTALDRNRGILDALTPIGALAVTLHEVPSSSLNVAVAAGSFKTSWGSIVSYAGVSSQAMTASSTNYLYLDNSGTLHVNTTGFPSGSFHYRLATVVTGTSTITSITDARVPGGAANVQSQPTMGSATAGATYGTNEQTMLQAVYNAVRALGLGT